MKKRSAKSYLSEVRWPSDEVTGPPSLTKLNARREALEARRRVLFNELWRALEEAGGWAARAGRRMRPPIKAKHASQLVHRFGLAAWARDLRIASAGRARGRPPDEGSPK